MKKLAVIGLVLMIGVSMAFASSLKVPWFVDNAAADTTIPPASGGIGLVYLTSNDAGPADLVCAISYYQANGLSIGPDAPNNTFPIAALSTLAFRPVADGGTQEGAAGQAVPDRPAGDDGKKNGSLVIAWEGVPTLVQGQYTFVSNNAVGIVSTAHLLPPGA